MSHMAERDPSANMASRDAAEATVVDRAEDRGGERVPRRTFELDETGFKEVPKRWRKFYRHWRGAGDELAPNEVICPVCKVVIRSHREFRPGDRVYCMPCMSRLVVVERPDGRLEADVVY